MFGRVSNSLADSGYFGAVQPGAMIDEEYMLTTTDL